jgi:hypothetical protein
MLALNHAVVGSLVGVTLRKPELVIPAALASHFVLDVFPHFGNAESFGRMSRRYYRVITADGVLTAMTVIAMTQAWPELASIMWLGAVSAVFPDLFWPLALDTKPGSWANKFFRFHKGIQTSETYRGIIYEIGYFMIFLGTFITLYFSRPL